jgi:hypothetical protein
VCLLSAEATIVGRWVAMPRLCPKGVPATSFLACVIVPNGISHEGGQMGRWKIGVLSHSRHLLLVCLVAVACENGSGWLESVTTEHDELSVSQQVGPPGGIVELGDVALVILPSTAPYKSHTMTDSPTWMVCTASQTLTATCTSLTTPTSVGAR